MHVNGGFFRTEEPVNSHVFLALFTDIHHTDAFTAGGAPHKPSDSGRPRCLVLNHTLTNVCGRCVRRILSTRGRRHFSTSHPLSPVNHFRDGQPLLIFWDWYLLPGGVVNGLATDWGYLWGK